MVQSLYRCLCTPGTETALGRWKNSFWKIYGINPDVPTPASGALAQQFGIQISSDSPSAAVFFAVQTFFATFLRHVIKIYCPDHEAESIDDRSCCDWSWPGLLENPLWKKHDQKLQLQIKRFSFISLRGQDVFGALYRELFPRLVRKHLGEFYTPNWLAEHLLRISGFNPSQETRILDPACGSGVFLLAAARQMLAKKVPEEVILQRLHGFDLNPLAVLMTQANFAVLFGRRVAVSCFDSILGESEQVSADIILGNPPWVHWDKLPVAYRESTRELWQRYGLFSLSGSEARYGGAKKELALLMVMRVAGRFLKDDGRLAMVLPQSVFQTSKAGDGFRRFGEGVLPSPLKVLRVDDFTALRVFEDAAVKTATLLLQKNHKTVYPVPYYCWESPERSKKCQAVPMDQERLGSPWRIMSEHGSTLMKTGCSDYQAILGANTGGANGVYWVEILENFGEKCLVRNLANCSCRKIPTLEVEIESELLYPLLRWKDVRCFSANPSAGIIMAQDPVRRVGIEREQFERKYPLAMRYFENFEEILRNRAAYRKFHKNSPFYSMYNVCENTFAPIKVVWRRMESRIRAAVVEASFRPIVPQETCTMIAVNSRAEANYLAVILNSQVIHERVRSFCPQGSKGFGSPGILKYLPIPKYQKDLLLHQDIAISEQKMPLKNKTECLIQAIFV